MPMQQKLNEIFRTISPKFEKVKGSYGRIFADKETKLAILVPDRLNNKNQYRFNHTTFKTFSRKIKTKKFEHAYIAVPSISGIVLFNAKKPVKSSAPETILSALEKSQYFYKKNTKIAYHHLDIVPTRDLIIDFIRFQNTPLTEVLNKVKP